ncbi:MAG TPA: DUF433 domain-containing protein [Jatrophihabitans sp.]|nr:DUF433 domain-containing protein [Jatrophihabitans sp.]
MTADSFLLRELYSEADAARLLRLPQATLHYWLEGRVYRGRSYAPVLRDAPSAVHGDQWTVTWAEFIEAGVLAQYRRDLRVPLAELRAFVAILREQFGVAYPLATKRPWTDGKKLVIEAQESSKLPDDLWLYAPVSGQYLLLPAGQAFLDRVEFDGSLAVRWRPAVDAKSTVVIDPDVRFGKPSVSGISTEVLWEYSLDGYAAEEIADEFALQPADVEWALSYEYAQYAQRAA